MEEVKESVQIDDESKVNDRIGEAVIVSKSDIFGCGNVVSKVGSRYAVLVSKGYYIHGGDIENIYSNIQNKNKLYHEKFAELYSFGDYDVYDPTDEQKAILEELKGLYVNHDHAEPGSEGTTEEEGVLMIFDEDQIEFIGGTDVSSVRLIWNSDLTPEDRLNFSGNILLNPCDYDEALVGFEGDITFYDIDRIVEVTERIHPDCDTGDIVWNSVVPSCSYITGKKRIRFVEDALHVEATMMTDEEYRLEVIETDELAFEERKFIGLDYRILPF